MVRCMFMVSIVSPAGLLGKQRKEFIRGKDERIVHRGR